MRMFFHAQLKLPLCSCDLLVPGVIPLHYDMRIWVGNMVTLSVPFVFLTWCGVWASLPCRHPKHNLVFRMSGQWDTGSIATCVFVQAVGMAGWTALSPWELLSIFW